MNLKRSASSIKWIFSQQIALRGLVAAKFFVIAKISGPSEMGVIGCALMALSIIDALSDLGLQQATVHQSSTPTKNDVDQIFSMQLARGMLLALILLAGAETIASYLSVPEAKSTIQIASLILLVKGTACPSMYLLARARNFELIAKLEIIAAIIDIATTAALIILSITPSNAALLGLVTAEITKSVLSWLISDTRPHLRIKYLWRSKSAAYGRWIWGASALTLLINNIDKIILSKALGAEALGIYQLASKFSQLCVADVIFATSQYVFPTLSEIRRTAPDLVPKTVRRYLARTVLAALTLAALAQIFASTGLIYFMGKNWHSTAEIMIFTIMASAFGATSSICVAILRAIGAPHAVTYTLLLQLAIFMGIYQVSPTISSTSIPTWVAIATGCACASLLTASILIANRPRVENE